MKERRLRVSALNQPRGVFGEGQVVPSIRLSGKWLEVLGFRSGAAFVVRESPGRLELLAQCVDGEGILKGQGDGSDF